MAGKINIKVKILKKIKISKSMKCQILSAICFVGMAILGLLSINEENPETFQYELLDKAGYQPKRALAHIRNISSEPHSVGSDNNTKVKEYIIKECEKYKLDVSIQKSASWSVPFSNTIWSAEITNVVATVKGSDSSKSVLICAHYDSKYNSPGASDDGVAIAGMLETIRLLTKNRTELKNDIIFLFTDAEEVFLGAKAFVQRNDELLEKIGIVFNFEARGNSGSSIGFETSDKNGWLIREFRKAVLNPVANSLSSEIYKILTYDTDFTFFKDQGLSGMNFAFIDGYSYYHSSMDNLANVNGYSLKHQCSYIFNLVNHFGQSNLANSIDENYTFFNFYRWFVIYPSTWSYLIFLLCVITFVLLLSREIKVQNCSLKYIFFGAGLFIAKVIGVLLGVFLLVFLISKLYPQYSNFHGMTFYNSKYYSIAFCGLTILIYRIFNNKIGRVINERNFFYGFLVIIYLGIVYIQFTYPGAAYILLWPILFLQISMWINLQFISRRELQMIILFIGLIPAIGIWIPAIWNWFIVFSVSTPYYAIILSVLLLTATFPMYGSLWFNNRKIIVVISVVVVMYGLLRAQEESNPTKEKPIPTELLYLVDANKKEANWATWKLKTDIGNEELFTNSYLGPVTEFVGYPNIQCLLNKAPIYDGFSPADIEVLKDTVGVEGEREIKLLITSNRLINSFEIIMYNHKNVRNVKVGKDINLKMEEMGLSKSLNFAAVVYFGNAEDGITASFKLNNNELFEFSIIDRSIGLPKSFKFKDFIIPGFEYYSNVVLVKKKHEL